MCRLPAVTAVISLSFTLVTAAQTAQPRADLSGTWRMDESRSGSPGHQSFVGPVVRVIRHSPQSLEIDHTSGTTTTTLKYPLRETRPDHVAGATRENHGYWDGNRLVTETVQNIRGQTVSMKEVWSLAPATGELVIERVVEVEHGYTVKDGQNYSTVKDIFVRAPR